MCGAPDLIVEILLPGNSQKEMGAKFKLYEESGVKEYWVVNPLEEHVLIYVLNENHQFTGLRPYTKEEQMTSSIFPDLKIDLPQVFSYETIIFLLIFLMKETSSPTFEFY